MVSLNKYVTISSETQFKVFQNAREVLIFDSNVRKTVLVICAKNKRQMIIFILSP